MAHQKKSGNAVYTCWMEISGSITNQQQPTTNNQAPAATKTIDPNFLIMWKELYTKLDLPPQITCCYEFVQQLFFARRFSFNVIHPELFCFRMKVPLFNVKDVNVSQTSKKHRSQVKNLRKENPPWPWKRGYLHDFFPMRKVDVGNQPSVLLSQRSHFKKKGKGEVPKNTISNFVLWDPPPVWFSFAAFTWLCNFLVESSPRRFKPRFQSDRSTRWGEIGPSLKNSGGAKRLKIEVPNRFQVCNKSIVDI